MKKLYTFLFICLLTAMVNKLSAQEQRQVVFQGEKKIKGSEKAYDYFFTKGDKVLITLKTEKDKEIKSLVLKNNQTHRAVLNLEKTSTLEKTLTIPKDGVYAFQLRGKAMVGRECSYSINRLGNNLDNIAYTEKQQYTSETVEWKIDSMIGYQDPVTSVVDLRLFNRYHYMQVPIFSTDKQLLGQAGIHQSQAARYNIGMNGVHKPTNGIFKGYNYQFSSVLGGAKHWKIADYGSMALGAVASAVLTPAAGFVVAGTMAAIGPRPGSEPAQYFMTYDESALEPISRIYSYDKTQRQARNVGASIVNSITSKVAGTNVARKVYVPTENDFAFNEKGKVTLMSITQARKPEAKYFIMANPESTQAKNTHLEASAIYYVPNYKTVPAEKRSYNILTTEVDKSTTNYKRRSYIAKLNY